MNEKWEKELDEVLRDSGVPATQRLSLVVLYHRSETACGQRLEGFCRLFTRQFTQAYPYPSVCIDWRGFCLPFVNEGDILPYLAQAHILLMVISVECLLELHQLPHLYTALTKTLPDMSYRVGIVARSTPLDHEQIRLTAQFPTDEPSLAHCQEDDEIYTKAMNQVWEWAGSRVEQL